MLFKINIFDHKSYKILFSIKTMREKKIILEYQMSHLNTIFLDFFFFFTSRFIQLLCNFLNSQTPLINNSQHFILFFFFSYTIILFNVRYKIHFQKLFTKLFGIIHWLSPYLKINSEIWNTLIIIHLPN